MAYRDLREFIAALDSKKWLHRVSAPVDWKLEITEITDRLSKSSGHPAGAGGPALLFEKVKDSSIPLAINLFGTKARMELALQVQDLNDIPKRIEELMEIPNPKGLMEKLKLLPKLAELAQFPPKVVSRAPCQEVVIRDNPILSILPILQCWPDDAGRYITLGSTITRNRQTGRRNVGLYRLQIFDDRTIGMHWQLHKDGAEHWRGYAKGEKMPVAVAIGGDPASIYAASAPLPPEIDEYLFAGFLRKEPVEMVKGVTVDLEVPAQAEIVIEGYVEVGERRMEGPFGDHTGYYSLPEPYPVMHVTAITHRKNPIYVTTIVGRPPMEDLWLGKATERIFLPLIQKMVPEIVDMNLPAEGLFNNAAVVSIKKSYPGQARKVAHALWGLGQMMFTKVIIVVDEHVNVQDAGEVAWLSFMNIDPKRDCFFVEGPVDTLNHASPEWNYGSKMGIDATVKLKEEGHSRGWPDIIEMTPEMKALVTRRWSEYNL
ncbi:MAG: menaquinone biosynthesis decarboxylase [Candidatus Omnitrophica bacterium]|nr:menaquinone biosynthesis decarboxylase [Candidatus Omnitrophota bacterium]